VREIAFEHDIVGADLAHRLCAEILEEAAEHVAAEDLARLDVARQLLLKGERLEAALGGAAALAAAAREAGRVGAQPVAEARISAGRRPTERNEVVSLVMVQLCPLYRRRQPLLLQSERHVGAGRQPWSAAIPTFDPKL
jgi:hypothetical protein